jgi:hypothetical protein
MCALSMVFMHSVTTPSFSLIVAYCEFASGHDRLSHSPVREYGCLQNVAA